jgi:Ca2+-binding EF-hand superfamily protein
MKASLSFRTLCALAVCGFPVFLGTACALLATHGPLPTHAEIRAAFDPLDANHDGTISRSEWRAKSEMLFAALDKNHDRFVDRAEMGANQMLREAFPEADAKGDGRLSQAEFIRLREIIFRAADIDRDDKISFVEYELLVLLRRTGWRDRNEDGRIEMSELSEALAQAFPLIDTNLDGVLQGEECAFLAPAHREAMDPEKTGRITLRQFINGYRFLLGADQVNRNIVPRAVPLSPEILRQSL